MPLSNSVLRRYTPPTCTLEIVAKSSPLSRWAGQSVLKDLRFALCFDDPRKPEHERVTIRGDRTELEILIDTVHRYVQEFLELSPTQLPLLIHSPTTPNSSTLAENRSQDYTSQFAPNVNPQEPAVEGSSDQVANSSVLNPDTEASLSTLKPEAGTDIYLQPKGLLGHHLFLGRLANQETGPVIDLTVLQLFDLATALDEYAADGVALPSLAPPTRWQKPLLPSWTRTAAAVVLTAGVTTAAVKVFDQRHSSQQAAAPTANQTPILSGSPLSQVPTAPTTPLPIAPLPTPVLPRSIASSPKLAPPPPVTTPVTPTLGGPQAGQRPTLTVVPPPTNSLAVPPRPTPELIPGGSAVTPGRVASVPNSTTSQSSSRTSAAKTSPGQSTAIVPATPPPLPNLPSLNAPAPEIASKAPASRTGDASSQPNQAAYAPAANQKNTLFDNIPQVAEVRSYFQQRWKAPPSLNKTLEYSLLLNGDGSIQRITPLGKAAGDYIDRTGMPLPGEPFVSPVTGGGNPRIRLVLTPDNKVQAFVDQ